MPTKDNSTLKTILLVFLISIFLVSLYVNYLYFKNMNKNTTCDNSNIAVQIPTFVGNVKSISNNEIVILVKETDGKDSEKKFSITKDTIYKKVIMQPNGVEEKDISISDIVKDKQVSVTQTKNSNGSSIVADKIALLFDNFVSGKINKIDGNKLTINDGQSNIDIILNDKTKYLMQITPSITDAKNGISDPVKLDPPQDIKINDLKVNDQVEAYLSDSRTANPLVAVDVMKFVTK